MPGDLEQPILIRRFRGVDVSQDPAFIGVDALAQSDSFVPNPIFLLAKRQGQTLVRQLLVDQPINLNSSIVCAPLLFRAYDDQGNRYLLVIARAPTGLLTKDNIFTSTNDNTFSNFGGSFQFNTNSALYGAAQLGSIIYVGNGIDPLKAVNLGSPITVTDNPFSIGAPAGGGTAATSAADTTASEMFPGTYSFAYAVFNSVTKKWTQRFATQTFLQNPGAADKSIDFTSPVVGTYTLAANELFHLFLAPRNQPIEFATDQTPSGVGNNVATTVRQVSVDGTVVPIVGTARTGNLLLAHRGRLWVAGDLTPAGTPANASRVYATSIILPGMEQAIFDIQPYFPTNATLNVGRQDGDRITALARASMTITTQSPDSPLLIFKNTALWAFFGDILDDPNSDLLQLSAEIGCPAPFSVVETPAGTVFLGLESVYLVRPDQLIPIDVGYPLMPVIRQIPVAQRAAACAVYHRGFYKLALTPQIGSANTTQWWLDLRRGLGQTPSWWGPHTTTPVIALANGRQDPTEIDRAFQLQSKGNVGAIDQLGVFTDLVDDTSGTTTQAVTSRLTTSTLDDGAPFARKRFTRTRAIVRGQAGTSVGVSAMLDRGVAAAATSFTTPPTTGVWDGTWDGAWSGTIFSEVETPLTDDAFRVPYRTADFTLTHTEPVSLELHDLEVRYVPVDRPVA